MKSKWGRFNWWGRYDIAHLVQVELSQDVSFIFLFYLFLFYFIFFFLRGWEKSPFDETTNHASSSEENEDKFCESDGFNSCYI